MATKNIKSHQKFQTLEDVDAGPSPRFQALEKNRHKKHEGAQKLQTLEKFHRRSRAKRIFQTLETPLQRRGAGTAGWVRTIGFLGFAIPF